MKRFTLSYWRFALSLIVFIFCLKLSAWPLEFTEWQKLDEPIGGGIQSVSFSPSGKYLALSSNNKIVLYGQAWKELWQELLDQWRYEIVNPHPFRRIEE